MTNRFDGAADREENGRARLRITCVIGPFLPVPPLLGGAVEKIFLALCEAFAAEGHDVTMISRRYRDLAPDEMCNGVRHMRIASSDMPRRRLEYRLRDIIYALRVRRKLPLSDITITNSVSLPLLLSKAQAGKIYVNVARYPKGQMGMYARVNRLQACSSHIANAIIAQSPRVTTLVKVLPNALTSTFSTEAAAPLPQDRAKEVIFVGRVAREKGIDLLIRAFAAFSAQCPDWRLRVIGPHLESQGGDGEAFLTELKALAGDNRLVEFTGPMFDEVALVEALRRAAVFVYPSVADQGEAFPLAPLEAMACGCATVVSDLRCFDDAVIQNENALVFDHRDPTGAPLAAVLGRLAASRDLRIRLSAAAKATSRRYRPDSVAKLFIADFHTLLRSGESG